MKTFNTARSAALSCAHMKFSLEFSILLDQTLFHIWSKLNCKYDNEVYNSINHKVKRIIMEIR